MPSFRLSPFAFLIGFGSPKGNHQPVIREGHFRHLKGHELAAPERAGKPHEQQRAVTQPEEILAGVAQCGLELAD